MAKIRWSNEAEQWLREIYQYIAKDNPSAAEKVVSGIYDKAQFLSDFPQLGHKYREEQEGDIRVLLYGHYAQAFHHLHHSQAPCFHADSLPQAAR